MATTPTAKPLRVRKMPSRVQRLEERLARDARLGLPVATLVLAAAAAVALGPPAAILVLAGGALIAVIATFWASVRTLFGETPLAGADAYALGAPRAEEEQKRAVLRALKDLEFERSVGKISEEDYDVLVAKYRAEAKQLLRILDSAALPGRREVEVLVAKHLRRAGLSDADPAAQPDDDAHEDVAAAKRSPKRKEGGEDDAEKRERARCEDASKTADDSPNALSRSRSAKVEGARESDPEAATDSDRGELPDAEDPVSEDSEPTQRAPGPRPSYASATATPLGSVRPAPLRMKKRAPTVDVVCSDCGTQNDEDAIFCKKCGKRCATDAAPAAAPSAEEEA